MTTESLEALADLTTRLVSALCDYPRELVVEYRPMRGRVDWHLTANINDQGKIVGRGGAHIKALTYLFAKIGEKRGEQFKVFLHDGVGAREPEVVREPAADSFSPEEHRQLLKDVLCELLEQTPMVNVHRSQMLGDRPVFLFVVTPCFVQDNDALADDLDGGPSIIDSLAAIFAAAGSKAGAVFTIEAG